MSLRKRFNGFVFSLIAITALGVSAHAQQTANEKAAIEQQQQQQEGAFAKRHGRRHREMGPMRLLGQLDLSDAQQQQARQSIERFLAATETPRAALRELHRQRMEGGLSGDDVRVKAESLRAGIKEAQERMRSEVLALLTAEQRASFDKLEQEMKARRDERRARHAERRARRGERMPEPDDQ